MCEELRFYCEVMQELHEQEESEAAEEQRQEEAAKEDPRIFFGN